jgi:hypothetical protein
MIPVPSVETMLLVIVLTLATVGLVVGGLGALFNHTDLHRRRARPGSGGSPASGGPAPRPTPAKSTRHPETIGV